MLLSVISLLLIGCAGHPPGLDSPRQLTDAEKTRAIEIALGTPEAQRQLASETEYSTEADWLAVVWSGSRWSAYYQIDAEWETDPNLEIVPDSAVFYPNVLIKFEGTASSKVMVAVDLAEGKAVLVHEYPANKGPAVPAKPVPVSYEISPAPIHDVQINIAESYPPQVLVHIQGGLRDGCTTFHDLIWERDGNTVTITVTTRHPQDTACPAVYNYFEKNVNLSTDFVIGQEYTVHVNDVTETFVMQ